MLLFRSIRAAAVLLAASLGLTSCGSEPAPSVREHFDALVGEWEGTHRLLDYPEAYPARYTIRLDGDVLVHEFASEFEGGFTGHERMTVAEDGTLIAVWSDSSGQEPTESRGSWDGASRTLTMTGPGESWTTPGKPITYHHRTVYQDDTFDYTMTVTEDGVDTEVMWIKMTRRKAQP